MPIFMIQKQIHQNHYAGVSDFSVIVSLKWEHVEEPNKQK